MKSVSDGIKALLALLDALPNKQLIGARLWDAGRGCGCLFGSVMPEGVREGLRVSPVTATSRGVVPNGEGAKAWMQEVGLPPIWVAALVQLNDFEPYPIGDGEVETPEEKYARVYGVLTQLAKCSEAGLDAVMRTWVGVSKVPLYKPIENWGAFQ